MQESGFVRPHAQRLQCGIGLIAAERAPALALGRADLPAFLRHPLWPRIAGAVGHDDHAHGRACIQRVLEQAAARQAFVVRMRREHEQTLIGADCEMMHDHCQVPGRVANSIAGCHSSV